MIEFEIRNEIKQTLFAYIISRQRRNCPFRNTKTRALSFLTVKMRSLSINIKLITFRRRG